MLAEYFPILIFIAISLVLGVVLLLTGGVLGWLLGHAKPDDEKTSPYECGFEAFEDTRSRFDVRYYLVAIEVMVSAHLILAAIEGAVTAAAVGYLSHVMPELLQRQVSVDRSVDGGRVVEPTSGRGASA